MSNVIISSWWAYEWVNQKIECIHIRIEIEKCNVLVYYAYSGLCPKYFFLNNLLYYEYVTLSSLILLLSNHRRVHKEKDEEKQKTAWVITSVFNGWVFGDVLNEKLIESSVNRIKAKINKRMEKEAQAAICIRFIQFTVVIILKSFESLNEKKRIYLANQVFLL